MRLFIAEKPELAVAICDGLGGGFAKKDGYYCKGDDFVAYCFGHMLRLYDPEEYDDKYSKWSLEHLPFNFNPVKYKCDPDKKKQVGIIKNLVDKADLIVNAGDPDDEGQYLIDELLRYFNNTKPVKRVLINDNTTKVVQKALNNLKPNSEFEHLGFRAEARSIADQIFGFNLSRAYTLKSQEGGGQGVLSIGRVQTPVLGLVVRRDRENKAHKKAYYYTVTADFTINGIRFTGKYQPSEADTVNDKGNLSSEDNAKKIVESCQGQQGVIVSSQTSEKTKSPPLPYNLIKLQQDASRKFGLKSDQTLAVTQSLREKHKLITYNRSDCQYLSDEQFENAEVVLNAVANTASILSGAISHCDSSIKGRVFNSSKVSAHHAIIPTETIADLNSLSENEKNIYLLIARSYLAQFYPNYVYDSTVIELDVNGHKFKVTAKVDKAQGWKPLYKNDVGNDEVASDKETVDLDLRQLNKGMTGPCENVSFDQKETRPPNLYTEATLLRELTRVANHVKDPGLAKILREKDKGKEDEHGGIGTSATRHTILQTLFDRGYVTEHKKNIVSTKLGQNLYDTLDDIIRYPDMTAIWHEKQQDIRTIDDVYNFVGQVVSDAVSPEVNRLKNITLKIAEVHNCPKCDRPLRRIKGKKGYFWGCTGYNDDENPCNHTMDDKRGKPVAKVASKKKRNTQTKTDHACKSCGKPLVHHKGTSPKTKKKYSFFGCSDYPNCKQTYQEKDGLPVFE